MALQEVGIKLVLDPGSFYADLGKAGDAVGQIGIKATDGGAGFNALEQVAIGSLRRIGEMAINAGVMIAQGIAGGIGSSITVAADFEGQMSGIQAVLSPTAAEFDALRQKALDLGSSTAYSASEAAEAIEMLAKNGLDATAILGGAADATLALAAATGGDLAGSADIMTDAMAIFGISVENVGDAINGIAGVTVASKFTIDDYRLALAQAGGVAGSLGVEFDDFNTAIAGISPLFASGSDAGTSFKTMLQRLAPTTGPAKEAMKDLGLFSLDAGKALEFLADEGIYPASDSMDDIKLALNEWASANNLTNSEWDKLKDNLSTSAFFDTNGQMKGMAEISGILQEALSGLSEEEKNVALSTIFGTDAMRAAVGLANLGTEGFNELAASIGGVDASLQAETRLDNFNGALEQMRGAAETLQIVIGSALLPILTQLLNDVVTPAVNQISLFAQALTGSQEAMASLSPPLQQVVTVLQSLAQYAGEAASVFGTDGLGASIATFGAGVTELNPVLGRLIQSMATVVDFLANNWQTAVAVAGGILAAALVPALAAGAAAFGAAVVAAAPVIAILAAVGSAAAALKGAWDSNFGGIQKKTAAAMAAVQSVIQSVLGVVMTFWERNGAQIMATADRTWKQVQAIIGTIAVIVAEVVTRVFGSIAKFIDEHGATIQRVLDFAWSNIQTTIDLVMNTIQGIVTTILGIVTGDWETASTGIQQIVDGIYDFVTDTFNNILSLITDLGPDFLKNAKELGQNIIDGVVKAISSGAQSVIDALTGMAQSALDNVKKFLGISSPSRVFAAEVGYPMAQGIAQGILDGLPVVASAIDSLAGEAKDKAIKAFEGVANAAAKMFDDALGGQLGLARARQKALKDIGKFEDELVELRKKRGESDEAEAAYQRLYARFSEADQMRAAAQHEAEQIARVDAAAARDYLALRETQIAKILDLEAERDKAVTKEQIARANRMLQLEREAQQYELEQFKTAMAKRARETAALGSNFEETGVALIDGMIAGIQQRSGELSAALSDVMGSALRVAQQQLGIRSPSVVFATEVGQPIAEGIALGIGQAMPVAMSAVSNMAAGLVRPAAPAVARGGSSVSSVTQNFNYSPVYNGAPRQPTQDFAALRAFAVAR